MHILYGKKTHNGHQHDSIKLMAAKHRVELKKITDPVEGMIKNLSEARDDIEKIMMKIRNRVESGSHLLTHLTH